MSSSYTSNMAAFANLDAMFRAINDGQIQGSLYDLSSKFVKWFDSKIEKVNISQAGFESQLRTDFGGHITFIPAGGSHPVGINAESTRFKLFASGGRMTKVINGTTYEDLTNGDPQVQKNAFTSFMKELREFEAGYDHNREILAFGDGSGALGYILGTSTTTQLDMCVTPDTRPASGYGARALSKKTLYDLVDLSTRTVSYANVSFSGVSKQGNYATCASALGSTPSAGLAVIPAGTLGYSPNGLAGLVPPALRSGWFQGMNVSDFDTMQHNVVDGGGNYPHPGLVRQLTDKALYKHPDMQSEFVAVTSPNFVSGYLAPGYGQIEYQAGADSYGSNFDKAHDRGIQFNAFAYCPAGWLFYLPMSKFVKVIQMKDQYIPLNRQGSSVWLRELAGANDTGSDQYAVVYGGAYNYGLTMPDAPGVLFNCATAGYQGISSAYTTS